MESFPGLIGNNAITRGVNCSLPIFPENFLPLPSEVAASDKSGDQEVFCCIGNPINPYYVQWLLVTTNPSIDKFG